MDHERTIGDDVAAAYDHWSQTYEATENATRDLAARVLRDQFRYALVGGDVLEIGCGTGLNTRFLAEESRSVLALDFSAGMLEQARVNTRADNVRFEQQDIRSGWNVADESVAAVVCTLVLEHVADLKHVFAEMRRVLRPGGEFFVCELHPFRQLRGGQAQFADAASGKTVFVAAHLHHVSEYVNTALHHDFELLHLGEWRDDAATNEVTPPRLLSLRARAPRRAA